MKLVKTLLFLLSLLPVLKATGQKAVPSFSSPLGIDLLVTGAFGEIRSNHFHSGTDFQVQHREGLPVFAIEEGWVSRIKISPVGFGNALYIDHPGGFTSVYGHLKGYSKRIGDYAHEEQYSRESFEIDVFPANNKDTIRIKKGDLIGFAGNSGSSYGAHLHFEIRTTATERILNPLLFGFSFSDTYPPYITRLAIYPEDQSSFIKGSVADVYYNVKAGKDGNFHLAGGDTLFARGTFSLGVEAFDYFYNKSDRNGWYSMKFFADKAPFFSMQMDSFSFNETRYVNACIDFADNYKRGSRILCSKKMPGNAFSQHLAMKNSGLIRADDGNIHEILVQVGDVKGNKCNLRFWIDSRPSDGVVVAESELGADTVVEMKWNSDNQFESKNLRASFPQGSLYDDICFQFNSIPRRKGWYSDCFELHKPDVPVQKKFKVSIDARSLPVRLQSKAILIRIDADERVHSAGGAYKDGWVTTEVNQFGRYAIAVDTTPPAIKLIPHKSKVRKSIKYHVSDNLTGIEKYRGEVNGKWALVEWDPKNHLMVYWYDELVKKGKNTFRLDLEDEKGNKSSATTSIILK